MCADLGFRPLAPADAGAFNAAVRASREHLRPWMPWAWDPPMTVAQRCAWMAEHTARGDRIVCAWDHDGIAGVGSLHARIARDGLEIGYWVAATHVRRGVATEVARRACTIAFADPAITHVEIHHDVANVASGRVAARLGFVLLTESERPPCAPAERGVEHIWRLSRPPAARGPGRVLVRRGPEA